MVFSSFNQDGPWRSWLNSLRARLNFRHDTDQMKTLMSNTSPHCFVMGSDANRICRSSRSGSHKQKGQQEQRWWPASLVQPKLWKEVRNPNQMVERLIAVGSP